MEECWIEMFHLNETFPVAYYYNTLIPQRIIMYKISERENK